MTHLEWLEEERERVGTAKLAAELGIPAPSLRRILSTQKLSAAMAKRVLHVREILGEERSLDQDDEDEGIELDEAELAEYADLWGVSVDEAEDILAALPKSFETMTLPDVTEYIDALFDALEEQGWEGEMSDLWDLYYGYSPGGSTFAA